MLSKDRIFMSLLQQTKNTVFCHVVDMDGDAFSLLQDCLHGTGHICCGMMTRGKPNGT